MRLTPILCSAVAGLGHLWLRRYGAGAVLFIGFAFALNGVVLAALWPDDAFGEALGRTSAAVAAAIWLLSFTHVVYLSVILSRERACAKREELVRRALMLHLDGRHMDAEGLLERASRLCPEGSDPDVDFLRGAIARRGGRFGRARRFLRRCRRHDHEGKWRWEVEHELAALGRGRAAKVAPQADRARESREPRRLASAVSDRLPPALARPVGRES